MNLDPEATMFLVSILQVLILALGGWTLLTTIKTKERVIVLETQMNTVVKNHGERLRDLESS